MVFLIDCIFREIYNLDEPFDTVKEEINSFGKDWIKLYNYLDKQTPNVIMKHNIKFLPFYYYLKDETNINFWGKFHKTRSHTQLYSIGNPQLTFIKGKWEEESIILLETETLEEFYNLIALYEL
jgi:hypothetical protein